MAGTSSRKVKSSFPANRSFPGSYFNHHRVQVATISWGGKLSGNDKDKHWSFSPEGEDKDMRCDPVRTFPAVDCTPEWLLPRRSDYGLSTRCFDNGLPVNRSQKQDKQSE